MTSEQRPTELGGTPGHPSPAPAGNASGKNRMDGDLKTIYDEICRRHDGIAEFRAKLLTLLPIASGAGIFLLAAKEPIATTHLLPIGCFGAVVTIGLFLYELRGIHECSALITAARTLEHKLLPEELRPVGAFICKPDAVLRKTVGATGAALVIYPAVVAAWVYVAGIGAELAFTPGVAYAAVGAGVCAVLFGLQVGRLQRESDQQTGRLAV